MSRTIRLAVLTAGLSTPSSTRMLADELARASREALGRDGATVETQVVELREYAHDITDTLLTRFPGERLSMVVETVRAADAVIAVTPVFNVGASGLFKTFFDAVDTEIWRGKPVLLGATAGTPRHSLAIDYAIRPLLAYLKADVVPTGVFAASADFGADTDGSADEQPLTARVRRAGAELAALVRVAGGQDVRRAVDADTASEGGDGAPGGGDAAARGGGAPGESSVAVGLDEEFSDFVPMGKLLGGS